MSIRPASAVLAPAIAATAGEYSSDEMLVERIAAGDSLAMQMLFARHRMCFFDVWRQAGRFEGRSAVATWLLSITRFKALSTRRRRTHAELDETIETTVAESADNPEITLQKKNRGELVRAALMKLSANDRDILDLVYFHENSVEDCALILNLPVATVKARMLSARKKLAELVQEA
jgi:RNA polymerase sigma-70 factor, ECF subfamily